MDYTLLPKQRSSARRQASSDEMAEILRAWDDEDDEMVEFIQNSKVTENSGGFDEVDMNSGQFGDDTNSLQRSRAGHPQIWSAGLVRNCKTAFLFASFFGLGIAVAMLGPALLELASNTSTSLQNMSYIFTARSAGYLIGSMVGGMLFDKYNELLVLCISCLWSMLMMFVVPLVKSVYLLAVVIFSMANSLGSLETGGNVLILKLWDKKSRPYMQALHFAFALGAFVAPLLVKPFLTTPGYPPNATIHSNASTSSTIPPIAWAFWLGSIPFLVTGLGFLFFVFMRSCKIQEPQARMPAAVRNKQLGSKVLILSLFFAFLMLYVGLEVAYGGYLFTFGVKSNLRMGKDAAAYLVSVFWGCFALSRLAAVPLSRHIRPAKLLVVDIAGCFLASAVLASQFSEGCYFADRTKLWVGSALFGISMASVFPATFSWAEYFFDVSGRTSSLLVVGACLGEMLVPLLVGNLFTTVGPCVLMVSTLVISILVFLVFLAILIVGKYLRRHSPSVRMHYQKKQQEPLIDSNKDEVLRLLKHTSEILSNDVDD